MNQNTKIFIIGASAAVLSLIAGLGYQLAYSRQTDDPKINIIDAQQSQIMLPVSEYLKLLPNIAPPNFDQQAIDQMIDLLSSSAKSRLVAKDSRSLAMFSGVQDLPDLGASIGSITITDDENAQVETIWNYSGMTVTKVFEMTKQEGVWKIEKIN